MKISYRILLINFIIVVIVVGSSAFAFYSIMYNLLNSQQSKYLLNSANDFVYFYNEFLQDMEYDFLYLMKDDVNPQINSDMIKDRNIDFILRSFNDSTKMLASVSFVQPVNIKSQLFTLEEFNRDNPYAIIKGYRHLDGTYYYYGRILSQEELTRLSKKIGAEIAFIWQTTPVAVSNEPINNIYTYDIKSAFDHLSQMQNFALYYQKTEQNDLLATVFKSTDYSVLNFNFEFVIFTVLKEATELRTNLKYLLILIGFSGVVLSLILTFVFTDRIRRQITQLSNATEIIRHGNFDNKIPVKSKDELGRLANAFNIMVEELDKNQKSKQEYSEFITLINKNPTLQEISDVALNKIIKTCKFTVGAIFIVNDEDVKIISTHGLKATSSSPEELELLKPVIKNKEPIEITSAEDLPVVSNGLLSFSLKYILIQPILYNNKVVAVLELGGVETPSEESKEYLNKILEQLAIGLTNAVAFVQLENFVTELKNLNDDFQKQNDQIRKQNETLVDLHQKLKEKAGELEEQKQRAEEATKLKSQFLASMSHELRTPMNSILGLTELVLDQGGVTGKDFERVSVVLKSGRRLMSLINDILDLSKIEAGKMELREEDVLLDEIIMEAETSVSPLVINKKINFRVICTAEPKMIIRTDRGKVIQVLINLLANAIKFTDNGNVVLNVSQPNNAELQFEVIDTGVGISVDNQKVIFEEFRQVDGTSTKKYNGTGLGLAICKKITKMLNGTLEVESEPGRGSTFIFKIPLIKIGIKAAPIIENEEKNITAVRQSVFILEEDHEIGLMMDQFLSSLGYETIYYNREVDIVETIKRYNPIAIVIDLNTKNSDVWGVIKKLKENTETYNIQLIIVNIKNDYNKGYGFDVFDYYIKPAGKNLITTIKRLSATFGKTFKNAVLIDEDNSEVELFNNLLAEEGTVVRYLKAGGSVIQQLIQANPDVIFIPMILQNTDGVSLINQIKLKREFKHTPLIVALPALYTPGILTQLNGAVDQAVKNSGKHSLDVLKIIRDKLKVPIPVNSIQPVTEDIIHDASDMRKKISDLMIGKIIYKGNVLIVDDDPDTLFTINEIVESLGNKTILAKNGLECIEALTQIIPDLILLDIMMPEMDGFQTIKQIKQNEEWVSIPVFAVTAKAMTGDKDIIFKHGFDNYITKPIDAAALALKINNLLANLKSS